MDFYRALMVVGTKMVLHRQVLRLLGPAYEKCYLALEESAE